ncbi:MAG TPA: nitroreductase/quinone reductase family protein [Candidatus Binatia bacterium]|nr:nitroreductase/quinone reductase family protein [Candidatus Binatia bacterium]
MKALKIAATVLLAYVGIVVAFESFLGLVQPQAGSTIVITTTGEDGESQDRVVTPMETDGHLYVSANHWPRSWYKRALRNPQVHVTRGGEKQPYVAVPVTGAEHDRVQAEHPHGFAFRLVTGFPPRYFLRLDPR